VEKVPEKRNVTRNVRDSDFETILNFLLVELLETIKFLNLFGRAMPRVLVFSVAVSLGICA
jgi:hypothetical protein